MLKISNIKYPILKDEVITYDMLIDYIFKYISKKYKVKNLCNVELIKKSLDARTSDLTYILSAVFSCSNESALLKDKNVIKYNTPNELIELKNLRIRIAPKKGIKKKKKTGANFPNKALSPSKFSKIFNIS